MKILSKFWQHSTKFELLLAFYLFLVLASETLGYKLIYLGHFNSLQFNISVAVFFLPLIYSINDIVAEVYGLEKTISLARLSLTVIFLLGIFCLIFTSLPPAPRFASSEPAYDAVFGFSARVSLASLTAFIVAQVTDIFVFKKIRTKLKNSKLWLRNNLSNLVALLVDTIIFMTIARWNLSAGIGDNLLYLLGLIIPYWLAKLLVSAAATPLVYQGVKWLKKN